MFVEGVSPLRVRHIDKELSYVEVGDGSRQTDRRHTVAILPERVGAVFAQ